VVSLQSYSGGVVVLNVASGFNGSLGSTYTIPNTNRNVYEIIYRTTTVQFYVNGSLLHSATNSTAIFSGTLDLPIGATIVNGASATSRTVEVWSAFIVRYGKEVSRPQKTYIAANVTAQVLKTGAGTLQRIIVGTPVNNATITIYDAVTATNTISLLTCGSSSSGGMPISLAYDIDFITGLCITTSGATTVTVVYD
jgi:ribosomal protein L14